MACGETKSKGLSRGKQNPAKYLRWVEPAGQLLVARRRVGQAGTNLMELGAGRQVWST